MLTLFRLAFRAEMKSFPAQYEQQRNAGNWNKSLTHMEGTSYRTGAVGREGLEPEGTQQSLVREGYAQRLTRVKNAVHMRAFTASGGNLPMPPPI